MHIHAYTHTHTHRHVHIHLHLQHICVVLVAVTDSTFCVVLLCTIVTHDFPGQIDIEGQAAVQENVVPKHLTSPYEDIVRACVLRCLQIIVMLD